MSITITGAEFTAFVVDPYWWGEEVEIESLVIQVNGEERTQLVDPIDDDAEVTIEQGTITHNTVGAFSSLIAYYRSWKRHQTDVIIVVKCPADLREKIRTLVEDAGGSIES